MRRSAAVVFDPTRCAVGLAYAATQEQGGAGSRDFPLLGLLAPMYPEWLGNRGFVQRHSLRFAYLGGSMARGIASAELVIALAECGALGMFGAAGLQPQQVEAAIERISQALGGRALPWGCNLIHSPNEPGLEDELVALFLRHDVRRVEASAFMRVTRAVVRYACAGLRRGEDGQVLRQRHLFAKVSREEVASQFLAPAPDALLRELVAAGQLSSQEAELAREVPLAEQLIVEADSGGHTDNRPLTALFPVIARLRDALCQRHGYRRPVYLGAAGGLGTPDAVAAAFALGADYVVVGSVHQGALESGVSDDARELLAQAGPADVAMTASADMFEMGVKVQVLTRGSLMAVRGNQLYELYRRYGALEEIPPSVREGLEKNVFHMALEEVWQSTQRFFAERAPDELERALREPRHRMALVFRWYLGNSSRWPLVGEQARRADYQLWCGPAMGAFNRWVVGSFLEPVGARGVSQIALNLLEGAAMITRAQQYRSFGVPLQSRAFHYQPRPLRLA